MIFIKQMSVCFSMQTQWASLLCLNLCLVTEKFIKIWGFIKHWWKGFAKNLELHKIWFKKCRHWSMYLLAFACPKCNYVWSYLFIWLAFLTPVNVYFVRGYCVTSFALNILFEYNTIFFEYLLSIYTKSSFNV